MSNDFQKLADIIKDDSKMADPIYRRGVVGTLEDMAMKEKKAMVDNVVAEVTQKEKQQAGPTEVTSEFDLDAKKLKIHRGVIKAGRWEWPIAYPKEHQKFKFVKGINKIPTFMGEVKEADMYYKGNKKVRYIVVNGTPLFSAADIDNAVFTHPTLGKTKNRTNLMDTGDMMTVAFKEERGFKLLYSPYALRKVLRERRGSKTAKEKARFKSITKMINGVK